ncbi:MAG TPA: thiamine phosphate synthase, partial [Dongiaceae bacterium]|nr:thiamine phosphate synthase [Dongiaceae bacterium]
ISLREKALPPEARGELARELVAIGRAFGATIMVHGDVDAAKAAGARGVHVASASLVREARRALGDRALVGVSAHSRSDIIAASAVSADYVTLSPVFVSQSKPGYGPLLGLERFQEMISGRHIPVLALGGITEARAASCMAAGAAGIAVMGDVMRASSPKSIAAAFIETLRPGSTPYLSSRKLA